MDRPSTKLESLAKLLAEGRISDGLYVSGRLRDPIGGMLEALRNPPKKPRKKQPKPVVFKHDPWRGMR